MPDAEPSLSYPFSALQRAYGLARSAVIYRAQPWKRRRALALYGRFIRPGELCFDVGAHFGDRVGYFRRLGARVVAIEPQPQAMRVLRSLYGASPTVILVEAALGAAPGTAMLHIDPLNPTVASLAESWPEAVGGAAFRRVRWRERVAVSVTTLDDLVTRHGVPAFCKIDVEGFEAAVLQGLSRPLPALSFEYVTACLDGTVAALARLEALGDYVFNRSPGESLRLLHQRWRTAAEMAEEARQLPAAAGSGDIYAKLRPRA